MELTFSNQVSLFFFNILPRHTDVFAQFSMSLNIPLQ
jgi:hypothetical protein